MSRQTCRNTIAKRFGSHARRVYSFSTIGPSAANATTLPSARARLASSSATLSSAVTGIVTVAPVLICVSVITRPSYWLHLSAQMSDGRWAVLIAIMTASASDGLPIAIAFSITAAICPGCHTCARDGCFGRPRRRNGLRATTSSSRSMA
jgi:hypothetical protein